MERAKLGPNINPGMSTQYWNSISSIVAGSFHAPTASSLDFLGLNELLQPVKSTVLPYVSCGKQQDGRRKPSHYPHMLGPVQAA